MTIKTPIKRSKTLDVLRGLLFVLMANTHSLSLLGLEESHWLLSDLWLPNGWATVVYVVLSGYGIGWVFSVRHPAVLHRPLLRRRSILIVAVMLVSNSAFAIFKLLPLGELSSALTLDWWVGFITLTTPWSISGVLLPTVLVLLCAPTMIQLCRKWPWQTFTALVVAQVAVNLAGRLVLASAHADSWAARFFLLEGLGGFPVLPFVLNGCIGCWLGIYRHKNESVWLYIITLLLLLQLAVYASTFAPPEMYGSIFRQTVGPLGKFAWVFLCAGILARSGFKLLISPIALIGKFALTTFVMHRIFLQAIHTVITKSELNTLPGEIRYLTLWLGTLTLTWTMCFFLQRYYNQNRDASPRLSQNKVSGKDEYFTR